MPVDTSLYQNRTPQDPIASLGGTVNLANALTNNQLLNAQNQQAQGALQGQSQFGQALMDANGNPTQATNLFTSRGGNPMAAPGVFQSAATLQGSQGSAANTIAAGNQSQTSDALAAANAIAENGGGRVGVLGELGKRVSNGLLSAGAYHAIVDGMPASDKGAADYVRTKTQGMVAAPSQVEPVQAGVNPQTQNPVLKPKAAVVAAAAQPSGTEVTAPPGAPEVAASDRKTLFEDQIRASGTMANLRPLQQALPLIQQLSNQNFGPGSNEFAKIKGALTTAGIINPNTSDLQVRQELNKYLLKYSSGANAAGRSDAALSAAIGSNPNLDLTQPANLALVKNQIGYDKMDSAMPKVYALDAKPGQTYSEFKSSYNQSYDPRAFKFDTLAPDEQQKLVSSLGKPTSPAFQKFSHSYDVAKSAGMVQPPAQGAQ